MYTSKFKTLLATLMLAFTMSVAFSGCSSTEETPPPDDTGGGNGNCPGGGPRGDDGICCDVDMMQPGCPGPGS